MLKNKRLSVLLLLFTILTIQSCSENYEIIPSINPVLISSDNTLSIIGNPVILKATQDGEDITDEAIFQVNGEPIDGNTYNSNEVGEFSVTATYQEITSETLVIEYHNGTEVNFKKRVLIEDYTGTWCGYCARVAYAVEQVLENTSNAVLVGIHRDSSNPNDATYDPYNYDTSSIEEDLEAVGYPKGYLNRNILWESPEPEHVSQVLDLTQGENPKLGLALTNTIENNSVSLDINVKIAKTFTELKLVVYVLENGLIYEQKNYTQYFDGENPIEGFEHNHVLRSSITNLTGDTINISNFDEDNIYTTNYTFSIPENVSNSENIEFVAFVIDENGTVINVRKSGTNETQYFEQI
ncbi:Outer membrane protein Omp28 [Mesonia phycicola]|uniref:Outer membrane protein Omp28 n=1 Tax=Mesonia phycicola TaxID=579105 RepID=A0A1M6FD16_9FLAO|nr:Omp28-related outer membrane protein [Mesonia phycicola]SHI95519.1 Outer membrane protein Omp28 [Mesonia phycicola]